MPKLAVTDGAGKRVAILARVTPTVREGLETAAGASGRSLSLEIETRLQASFELDGQAALQNEVKAEMRDTIAALKDQITTTKNHNTLLWPDKNARILGEAFALTVIATQQQFSKNWRESGSVVAVVVAAMRDVMTKLGRPGAEFDTLANRARIDEATSNIAKSIVETFAASMPPLPEPRPSEQSPMTGRARLVTTFKDKATGAVLETTTGPEFDRNNPQDRLQSGPEYRVAIERYRPRRDSIDIETSIVHVLADGSSAWDTLPEDQPGTRLVGSEEAATDFEPARGLLPASIDDTALLHETMGPAKADDTPMAPVAPAAPAPTRPRKARVKV